MTSWAEPDHAGAATRLRAIAGRTQDRLVSAERRGILRT